MSQEALAPESEAPQRVRDPRQHCYVMPQFFAQADAMRASFDEHFSKPFANAGNSHQIWDYWYVPHLYTYMRTDPQKIIPARLCHMLHDALSHWALETLGLTNVSNPYLSLYVNGCGQSLHNDAKNGRWGFVFSLTHWENRKFTGGETMVFKEEHYFESEKITDRAAGGTLYNLVPSLFNQLVVFDDRVIHGVQPVQGTMDPREGRIAIHGHIREGGLHVQGALPMEDVTPVYQETMETITTRVNQCGPNYHGLMTFRLWVDTHGLVEDTQVLTDRIMRTAAVGPQAEEVSDIILATVQGMTFPRSEGQTRITMPVVINNTLNQ